ncbi:hydrolase, partial [Bacillus sp. Nf3]
ALHEWQQPFERITALAAASNVPVATPMMGEALDMQAPRAGRRWWEKVQL